MFIQVMQGRALDPPGIRRELNRWQRQLATDADGWLGATAGVTEDGWSVVVRNRQILWIAGEGMITRRPW